MTTHGSLRACGLVAAPGSSTGPGPVLPIEPRRISSDALLQGAQELLIDHLGACYRLRLTAQGRLILTK